MSGTDRVMEPPATPAAACPWPAGSDPPRTLLRAAVPLLALAAAALAARWGVWAAVPPVALWLGLAQLDSL